ncbi:hypothetical protein H6G97_43940 [Nostoc flagelliforme FACHB-838]|uniref:Transposase n=1 Tax=Nostoc flagelliforme FACHB-838 TaxID=2692904 RepID=A0ABR8E5P2_9NOSO|nr:hypothetical protein [Nostoc flagelliforme FACHB-838]
MSLLLGNSCLALLLHLSHLYYRQLARWRTRPLEAIASSGRVRHRKESSRY